MSNLSVTTPSDLEIAMTRRFAAPRHLVYKALITPELVKRWLGPERWPLVICEIDAVVGGTLRYLWRNAEGTEMGMRGTFLEVVENERLVHTEVFDDPWYPGEAVATTQLAEQGGRTTMVLTVRYESKEIRDGVLASPMEEGVAESYDRLERLLAESDA